MRIIDRKKIARLMVIQDVSARRLAEVAGWRSHTYLRRILSGEVNTVTPERAARIAEYLGVGMDDLFVARTSTPTGRSAAPRRAS